MLLQFVCKPHVSLIEFLKIVIHKQKDKGHYLVFLHIYVRMLRHCVGIDKKGGCCVDQERWEVQFATLLSLY